MENSLENLKNIKKCILTGYKLQEIPVFSSQFGPVVEYKTPLTGKVRIGLSTLIQLQKGVDPNRHPILAGICRHAMVAGEEPPIINQEFLESELQKVHFPKSAVEKSIFLLKFLFNHGDSGLGTFELNSARDYPLCFALNKKDFEDILNYMINVEGWLSATVDRNVLRSMYVKTYITKKGKEEIEKELPQIPLIGLVNQSISTGDISVDQQINHAKDLFFRKPQSLENMRSACETLSYILEPLRKEMIKYFSKKDVEVFFRLVNEFDIRHNKHHTTKLVEPVQLEWVFYTLLNSINTFVKLRSKIAN